MDPDESTARRRIMMRSTKEVMGYTLQAVDGDIGRCRDFLFDDVQWTIRYMVADTGKWIPDKKVLISPISLAEPDWGSKRFPVHLTKDQIEGAPSIEEDQPVSLQHEVTVMRHYGYPYYWVGDGLWGMETTPAALRELAAERITVPPEPKGDPHLRSVEEVTGYHVQATDGDIGHVEEFVLDEETWALRYMVVDTRNWLPGKKVLVSPAWVSGFDWPEGRAVVDLTREQIKNSPEYDPNTPINREYEARLYDFYGWPAYWK
jgi:hypothetical protein